MESIRKKVGLLAISQICIFLIMILSKRIVYATNDDTTMVALACGGYGTPSPYIMNMHILIGYFLKSLFTLCQQINWMTIFYLAVYGMGAVVLDFVFAVRKKGVSFVAATIVVDLALLVVLNHFTFTVLAFWSGISGVVALTFSFVCGKSALKMPMSILGTIMLLLAALIRGEIIQSLMIVYAAVIAFQIIRFKSVKPLIFSLVAIVLMFVSIQSNTWLINRNPIQKQFYEWGETRSAALDCQAVPYNEAVFKEYGITQAQYNAIYGAFYYDFDTVDKGVMETLIKLNTFDNKYNLNLIGFVQAHILPLSKLYLFDNFYRLLFGAVLLFYLICGKKDNLFFALLVWTCVILNEMVFYILNRSLYRVIMPGYIFAVLLLMLYCDIDTKKIVSFKGKRLYIRVLLLPFVLFLGPIGVFEWLYMYKDYHPWLYGKERNVVLEYMYDHADKIYLAGDPGVFSIDVSDSVWDCPKVGKWNLIGNWETYSEPYLELTKSHGIKDPYHILREAIDNEDILILTRNGSAFPESSSWILQLAGECYGKKIEFCHVEDICEVTNGSEVLESWAVYRLVQMR